MRKILFGVVITLIILFVFRYCENKGEHKIILKENTALIQQELKNVGKLVVTEGHFSEVFNYKNSKDLFGKYFTAEKKALIVVNANVTVSYNLSKIDYRIDEENKVLHILSIPEEEITINPDFEYYDIQADFLNPFKAKDYNDIKETVKKSLSRKIENSSLKTNAKSRLISELGKFYILTNSLGWKLTYNETSIDQISDFKKIKP